MEISIDLLNLPKVVTIPDLVIWIIAGLILLVAVYGAYRIFIPREPDPWLRGG